MYSTDIGRLNLADILLRSRMLMSDSAEAHLRICEALRFVSLSGDGKFGNAKTDP